MDFSFTPRQLETQAAARRFAQERVAPLARECDEQRRFPAELLPEMARLGFLAGKVGPQYGGHGLDAISMALVYEELGKVDSSIRGFLAVHAGLVCHCIDDLASEEQKRKYLPELAGGRLIGCYALTEPEAGSDAASLRTTARRDGDSYVLNGEKHWITNGNLAGLGIVFATVDPEKKHKGVCAFLVETDALGIERKKMPGLELGHRASDHAFMRFKDCRVPAAALLGGEGEGFKVAMAALNHGRLGVAAGALGVAEACLEASVNFTRNRRQFGKAIADFQMIQAELAEMAVQVEAARWLVYRAAERAQAGADCTFETSAAKLYATEAAMKIAGRAVLLHGARGYSNAEVVERHFRDIKGYEIYEGTSHIQKVIIARRLLKDVKS